MKYFEFFPKIVKVEPNGTATYSTNIMTRVNLVPNLLKNPALFYQYTLKDIDTPEVLASKYYDNPYRYWIFLMGNQTIDPQWDLGLSYQNFSNYLYSKYVDSIRQQSGFPDGIPSPQDVLAYTQSTIKYYQEVITSVDSVTNTVKTVTNVVDYDTYVTLPNGVSTTKYFPDNSYVTITYTRNTVSIYDYELQENENKKQVNIVDKKYASRFEESLKSLLSQ